MQAAAGAAAVPVSPASGDTTDQNETQGVNAEAAPDTVIQEKVISVETEQAEAAVEPQMQSIDTPKEAEFPTVVENINTETVAAPTEASYVQSSDSTNEPVNTSGEGTDSQVVACSEEQTHCESSETKSEAPSSGQTPVLTPANVSLDLEQQELQPVTISDPNSLDVSVGSESAPSDIESMEEVKATQSSEDEVSTTSDVLEDEANTSKSPVSSEDPAEDKTRSTELSPEAQAEAMSDDASAGGDIEAGASESVEAAEATSTQASEPVKEETLSSPEATAPDSVKEIRDLVVEVFEVEELVQHYPSGVPKEE